MNNKDNKSKELKGIIHLEHGIDLIVPAKAKPTDFMVAVGVLCQILCVADTTGESGNISIEKFKSMMNQYIDQVAGKVENYKKNKAN